MRKAEFVGTRWLGVGLAAALAVFTISLAITGRLGLYINPDSTWFAVSMSVFVLIGAVASFALPLGAEADHGHDHGDGSVPSSRDRAEAASGIRRTSDVPEISPLLLRKRDDSPIFGSAERAGDVSVPGHSSDGRDHADRDRADHDHADHDHADRDRADRDHADHDHDHHTPHPLAVAATVVGGVAASGVVVLTLVLPPASLSAELAMSRDVGATPLFGGADTVQLASTGDTASFGVGEWATVFATATNPDAFDGDSVELTGFVTPGDDGAFDLTRLVITHCVIDAQPASLPVMGGASIPDTGQWVTITGTVRSSSDGRLVVDASEVDEIPEPQDPYEY